MSLSDLVNRAFDEPLAEPKKKNSAAFDLKSYEADGGDAWVNPKRELFFDRDKAKDIGLWDKAAALAKEVKKDWKFTVWWYLKHGGKF